MSAPARVLVADPAWLFGDAIQGKGRGAVKHYRCMPTHEICNMPLPPLDEACVLFLWRVAAMQRDALQVVDAWGFREHSELVWNKLTCAPAGKPCVCCKRPPPAKKHFGMGHILRGAHETCLVCVRKKAKRTPKPKVRNVRTTFDAPVGQHSEKPELFFEIVQRLYDGPYVELFARRRRPGWTQYGDELGKLPPRPANTNALPGHMLQVIA